jgi:hypothetical protein
MQCFTPAFAPHCTETISPGTKQVEAAKNHGNSSRYSRTPFPASWNTADRGFGIWGRQGHSPNAVSSKLSGIGLSADPCSRTSLGRLPTAGIVSSLVSMSAAHSPLFASTLRVLSIPRLAVQFCEIVSLELVPVTVDDADSTHRLQQS